jgi:hypothetical protein
VPHTQNVAPYSKELVSAEELLMSEVIQSEALINLLDKKGIISKQELLEEMKRVQAKMIKPKTFIT